jgi:hypothetical protein
MVTVLNGVVGPVIARACAVITLAPLEGSAGAGLS